MDESALFQRVSIGFMGWIWWIFPGLPFGDSLARDVRDAIDQVDVLKKLRNLNGISIALLDLFSLHRVVDRAA